MIQYKIADSPSEFEQIHSLNYATFVEEIPQHHHNEAQKLIDRFDQENLYVIALNEQEELVGMVCIREERPFSLDGKIQDLDTFLPANKKMCEIRLLAVRPDYRKTGVFKGLMHKLYEISIPKGYEIALISGTDRQLELYRHIGFRTFAEPVGTPEALFYPMYLPVETIITNPLFV